MSRQAYLVLLLAALFWGANSVAGKLLVGHVSPMLISALRWGFACAILSVIGHRHIRADWQVLKANAWFLGLLGFVGFTLFSVSIYSALLYTTAINASVLQAGMPAIIFLANYLVFRLRASLGQIFGFLLTLVGVAVAASQGELARLLGLEINGGDALVLLAAVFYALYSVGLRRKPELHWMTMMVALTAGGFVSSVPFAFGEWVAGTFNWPDAYGWSLIAFVVIFPSILGQTFYIRGVNLIGANRAGLFINLVPIFGTLLSLVVIGEAFHIYHAVALALALGGIALAEWSGRRAAAS